MKSKADTDVILDCERMKYPYTGLYEFCSQLAGHLISNNSSGLRLGFYVPPKAVGAIGSDARYLVQHPLHKFYNPTAGRCLLWHGTYQGSRYFPERKGIKRLLTIHDLNFMIEKHSVVKQKKYLDRVQRQVDLSDHITAISRFTLDFAKAHLDLEGKPVSVIYNGCDVNLDSHPPEKPEWLSVHETYLFSIGTIASKKNFHVLPPLLKGNDYKLIIAGVHQDRDYYDIIMAEARRFGVADRVVLPGAVSTGQKWWLMKHAAAFLLPSIAEGFGIPAVEAMYFDIPIFLSIHTSLPEIGGDAAYYFDSFEPDSMIRIFDNAMDHFNSGSEKAEKIRQRRKIFDWDRSAAEYLSIYDNLLSQ